MDPNAEDIEISPEKKYNETLHDHFLKYYTLISVPLKTMYHPCTIVTQCILSNQSLSLDYLN